MTKNGPPWPLTVPAGRKCGECVNGLNGYPLLYGSTIKFPPTGGGIVKSGGQACNFAYGNPITVKGAEWIFPGASPVPSWRTAGNEIWWFGGYGNQDAAGPGSAIPTPEVPLHWPYAVAVGPFKAHVGDRLNRRVVVVRLEHAAQESCPVPLQGASR